MDEFTRECPAIAVAGGIRSGRVIEVLTQLVSVHGAPRYLRSDNGPEFVARAILRWLQSARIETAFIDPGKPWQNGTDESFNGKFRDQHLSLQWFRNRTDAKVHRSVAAPLQRRTAAFEPLGLIRFGGRLPPTGSSRLPNLCALTDSSSAAKCF